MVQDDGEPYYRLPEDMGVLDVFPMAVVVCDFNNHHPAQWWGNKSWLKTMGKERVEDLKQIDMTKASEGMKRFHDDVYTKVQVRRDAYGPLRKTLHAGEEGASQVDISFLPIRVLVPGEDKPRMMALTYHFPVQLDDGTKESIVKHYMCDRVSSMAMLFAQADGTLIQQNSMARSHFRGITGRPDGDVSIREVLESFVWDDETERDSMLTNIQQLQMGDGGVVFERAVKQPHREKESAESWLHLRFDPTLDPTPGQKDRPAIIVSGKDVSEQRKAQGDLLTMHSQQEQFFAEMAHELRTPLHCIAGLAEAMQRDATCPRSLHKQMSIIHSQSMRLASMVSDIVDNAANLRKTLLIKHESVQLASLAQSACDTMAPLVKRGVRLVSDVPSTLPSVQADGSRIFQVLVNLIANAVRFTNKGNVKLSGRPVDRPSGPAVELCVADTGIGIPADKLESIFGAYQRVDATTTRKYGGTGLGLGLVKTLVEAHHGTVEVASKHGQLGQGTTFTITLPVVQPHMSTQTPRSIASSRGSGFDEEAFHASSQWRERAIDEEHEVQGGSGLDSDLRLGRFDSAGSNGAGEEGEWGRGRLKVHDRLAVLDHLALPCWVVDPATRPGPTIVWSNVVAARLWGREPAEMSGLDALKGPLEKGTGITAELYNRIQGTVVVEHHCRFAGERDGRLQVMMRRLDVVRGSGGDDECLVLHVGHPA